MHRDTKLTGSTIPFIHVLANCQWNICFSKIVTFWILKRNSKVLYTLFLQAIEMRIIQSPHVEARRIIWDVAHSLAGAARCSAIYRLCNINTVRLYHASMWAAEIASQEHYELHHSDVVCDHNSSNSHTRVVFLNVLIFFTQMQQIKQ